MEINRFQELSKRTVNNDMSEKEKICNMCFGIAGEVVDALKKNLFHGHDLDIEHITEELGDVMFYIVNLATLLNINMCEVLDANVEKLSKRYKVGFSVHESISRIDKQ